MVAPSDEVLPVALRRLPFSCVEVDEEGGAIQLGLTILALLLLLLLLLLVVHEAGELEEREEEGMLHGLLLKVVCGRKDGGTKA